MGKAGFRDLFVKWTELVTSLLSACFTEQKFAASTSPGTGISVFRFIRPSLIWK